VSRNHLLRPLRALRRRLQAISASGGDWLFNRRVLSHTLKREHALCLGDSHVTVMEHVELPGVWFRTKPLVGATASGVLNPRSKTNSLEKFTTHLEAAKPWQQVLLQLGEVDCGFVIWHRARRRNLAVEEQLTLTLDAYAKFIELVVSMGFRRVVVLSAPLPTIGDDPTRWGEIANLRKTVTASQAERTGLTLRFNEGLRMRCDALAATFVHITSGQLDPATGLIDKRFVRETRDHHLADRPIRRTPGRRARANVG
jgi:hypothetical protein